MTCLMGFGVQSDFFNWASPEFAKVQPIWGRWNCLWPNMAISGQTGSFWGSRAPKRHFLGAKRSKLFHQCSTHLKLLGLPIMAIFGPKNAIKWPKNIFIGPLPPPFFRNVSKKNIGSPTLFGHELKRIRHPSFPCYVYLSDVLLRLCMFFIIKSFFMDYPQVCRIGVLFPVYSISYILCPWLSMSRIMRKSFLA